jgi:hypothetical protein
VIPIYIWPDGFRDRAGRMISFDKLLTGNIKTTLRIACTIFEEPSQAADRSPKIYANLRCINHNTGLDLVFTPSFDKNKSRLPMSCSHIIITPTIHLASWPISRQQSQDYSQLFLVSNISICIPYLFCNSSSVSSPTISALISWGLAI